MELTLCLLPNHTEYPPLFVIANNAVDLYRDHYAIGAYAVAGGFLHLFGIRAAYFSRQSASGDLP